jgi:hypothetical protein
MSIFTKLYDKLGCNSNNHCSACKSFWLHLLRRCSLKIHRDIADFPEKEDRCSHLRELRDRR